MREVVHDPIKMWVSQKLLLRRGEEVLLLASAEFGLQDTPGGRLNGTITQNCSQDGLFEEFVREIEEEIGDEVTYSRPKIVGTCVHVNRKNDLVFLVFYEAEYLDGDIVLSGEHARYKWVNRISYDPSIDSWYPSHLEFMRDYFRGENQLVAKGT